MNIIRTIDRRAMYLALTFMLVLLLAVIPAMASALQLTERSIALSNSSKEATNVTYQVNFTAPQDAGAFVVDFCDSPVIGTTCTAPTGLDAAGATSATVGFTDVAASTSLVVVTGTIDVSTEDEISVELDGITNPDDPGPIYARVVTYDNDTNADLYQSDDLGSGVVDQGSVAISITDSIGVSGAVLESMLFCVADAEITENCANASSNLPVLEIGESVGDNTALIPTALSTGTLFTQISTNAASGAIITLKSDATDCGGLLRAGDEGSCHIAPALQTDIAAGQAKFGLLTDTAYSTIGMTGTPTGTLQAVTGSGYNDTTYALNYVDGDATGVTSVYGDPLLDTDGAPVNNQNMQITFGASVSNDTPAGTYSANLSMIATGRF